MTELLAIISKAYQGPFLVLSSKWKVTFTLWCVATINLGWGCFLKKNVDSQRARGNCNKLVKKNG